MPPTKKGTTRKTVSGHYVGRLHKLKVVYKNKWKKISEKMGLPEATCKAACKPLPVLFGGHFL
jgi:hypothetical protein